MSKKEITIENLAEKMDAGFSKSDKKFDDLLKLIKQNSADIENSARLTQNTILELDQKMNDNFANFKVYVDKRFDESDKKNAENFSSIRVELYQINDRITGLELEIKKVSIRTMEDDNLIFKMIDKLKRKEALGNN